MECELGQDDHICWDETRPSCTNMLALDEMDDTGKMDDMLMHD